MKLFRNIARKFFCVAMLVIVFLAGYNIILRRVYPTQYYDYVEIYSAEYDVSKYLVLAVIKCESDFDENAQSSAGAKGLMQLTEETFFDVSKMVGDQDKYTYSQHWNNAEINIKYGTKYLSYLYDMFGDKNAVIAAYNAGLGNVKNWIGNDNVLQYSEIKFLETADYVDKVLKAEEYYTKLY